MAGDYSRPTIDYQTKKVNFYSDIIHLKVAICENVTLHSYIQLPGRVVTQTSGYIDVEPKRFLLAGQCFRETNGILEVPAIRPF